MARLRLRVWAAAAAATVLLSLAATLSVALPAHAQEDDCLKCHKALANVKDGHAALKAGCRACHVATDGSSVPHQTTGKVAGGLSAPQPELCVACHNKPKFNRQNLHSAPAKGCTGCHGAHASTNEKLLASEVPDLCYSCHDEKLFKGKVRHKPVAQGGCLDCHDAHSTEQRAMLNNPPVDVCLECHSEDLKGKPHLVAGFSGKGHPLGDEKSATLVEDPLRRGMQFYCGSCHDPHRSDHPRLNRFDPNSPHGFCQRCHDK